MGDYQRSFATALPNAFPPFTAPLPAGPPRRDACLPAKRSAPACVGSTAAAVENTSTTNNATTLFILVSSQFELAPEAERHGERNETSVSFLGVSVSQWRSEEHTSELQSR